MNSETFSKIEEVERLGHVTDKLIKNGRKYVDSVDLYAMSWILRPKINYYFVSAHVWSSMETDLPHNVVITLSVYTGAGICASCASMSRPCFLAFEVYFLFANIFVNTYKFDNNPCRYAL